MTPHAVVLDLDDTLYLERDYVRSGFKAAGKWYADKTGLQGLEQTCLDLFAQGRRSDIFDAALANLASFDPADIAKLVDIYRSHEPSITLAEDARRYFATLRPGRRHAIITDGHAATQQAKVRALGLDNLVDHLVYTGQWGRDFWKPHLRAYEAVEQKFGLATSSMVYVADNPTKDFVTPRARGWWTIQLARPERVHLLEAPTPDHAAHFTLETLDGLDACLQSLGPDWMPLLGTGASAPSSAV